MTIDRHAGLVPASIYPQAPRLLLDGPRNKSGVTSVGMKIALSLDLARVLPLRYGRWMALWTLHAAYDPKAQVWYAIDCDVPGLLSEGATLEELRDRAAAVLPELVELNGAEISPERREGPHSLRLVAFHESTMPVAA